MTRVTGSLCDPCSTQSRVRETGILANRCCHIYVAGGPPKGRFSLASLYTNPKQGTSQNKHTYTNTRILERVEVRRIHQYEVLFKLTFQASEWLRNVSPHCPGRLAAQGFNPVPTKPNHTLALGRRSPLKNVPQKSDTRFDWVPFSKPS